jgi:hypothetical protein
MALPVIADTFIVTQHLSPTFSRAPQINRFCVTTSDGIFSAGDAAAFSLIYKNRFLPIMSSDIVLGNTDVLPLDGVSSTASYTTASAGSAGGNSSGTDLPNAVAQVVAWQTGLRGRSKRGRTYLPGVRSNIVSDNRASALTSAAVTALATAGNNVINDLFVLPHSVELRVLSLKEGSAAVVTHARGNAVTGLQRRRYNKVARH